MELEEFMKRLSPWQSRGRGKEAERKAGSLAGSKLTC